MNILLSLYESNLYVSSSSRLKKIKITSYFILIIIKILPWMAIGWFNFVFFIYFDEMILMKY